MVDESRSPAFTPRLALALSGLMLCLVVAGLLFSVGRSWFALIAVVAAVIAAADLVGIQRRRR